MGPSIARVAVAIAAAGWLATSAAHAQCEQSDSPVDLVTRDWEPTCKHPLCGHVYDARVAKTMRIPACRHDSWRPLIEAMHEAQTSGGVVLLGEIHDNAQHHRLRAVLFEAAGAIVFEQLRADQQGGLDQFMAAQEAASKAQGVEELWRLIGWDASPWSKTSDYRPLFEAAVNGKIAILAGDAPREPMRRTAKEGLVALPADERAKLGLDVPLGSALDAASLAEIDGSHCGMIPKTAQPNMALAQRYRDGHLADRTLSGARTYGSAVLIAGNGHIRTDRGVPWYLRLRSPSLTVVAVALVEVEDGNDDPAAYVPRDPDGRPAVDFVVFTPRSAERQGDPCAQMKAAPPPAAAAQPK